MYFLIFCLCIVTFTRGPSNTTVCIGRNAIFYCRHSGPNDIVPDWRIIMRNVNGSVISDRMFNGSSIVNRNHDGLYWGYRFLRAGPVNETFNRTSYQGIITIDGQSVMSSIGTLTVAGEYLYIKPCLTILLPHLSSCRFTSHHPFFCFF